MGAAGGRAAWCWLVLASVYMPGACGRGAQRGGGDAMRACGRRPLAAPWLVCISSTSPPAAATNNALPSATFCCSPPPLISLCQRTYTLCKPSATLTHLCISSHAAQPTMDAIKKVSQPLFCPSRVRE